MAGNRFLVFSNHIHGRLKFFIHFPLLMFLFHFVFKFLLMSLKVSVLIDHCNTVDLAIVYLKIPQGILSLRPLVIPLPPLALAAFLNASVIVHIFVLTSAPVWSSQ